MGPTQSDWSLQRKGPADQARHESKVREAIREHIGDVISDPTIISGDGKAIVRVPVHSLKEYRFRYDEEHQAQVGQGDGKTQVGQILAKGRAPVDGARGPGPGEGPGQAGHEPGQDVIEAEVSVDDLAEIVFADLALPGLQRKTGGRILGPSVQPDSLRLTGPLSALDKRRSLVENLRRNARAGRGQVGEWSEADLRFRAYRDRPNPRAAAAIIAMRDVSGSMGEMKKYITRSFFFWMVRFLRSRYDDVQLVFIAHHVDAREVDEPTFFQLGESGGTRVSSAYELALEVIERRFPETDWNIYPFHFSDGDNWGDADNRRCVDLARQLLKVSSTMGYGEINEGGYQSPLMTAFSEIADPRFIVVSIHDKREVYGALKRFFHGEQ